MNAVAFDMPPRRRTPFSPFSKLILPLLAASALCASALAQFAPIQGVRAVAAGWEHACLIDASSGVKCWGLNGDGQLGDGSNSRRLVPTPVVGLSSGVSAISVGGYHSCAHLSTGAVRCWGRNFQGQLGDGSTTGRNTPVDIGALGTSVTALAAGDLHTCAIRSGGALMCWGSNDKGQVGDGTTTNRSVPVAVSGLGSGVIAVAGGHRHSCAVASGGAVRCWGSNESGGLGDGTQTDRLVPTAVSGLASGFAAVSAGNKWSCGLSSGGAVKCWGHNADAELGDGTFTQRLTPVDAIGLQTGGTALRSGFSSSCVMLSSGGVKCWGQNSRGQLGDGTLTRRPVAATPVGLSSGVAFITNGSYHTCAVGTDGSLRCWGFNNQGQLGDATNTARLSPVAATGLTSGALAIDAGFQYTCAVTATRGVKCWGESSISNGQIQDGLTRSQRVPTDVPGLTNITAVATGENHACALNIVGAVACWGLGLDGQLGDGTNTNRFDPVTPIGLSSGVRAVVAGGHHSCALMSVGTVKCWGLNFYGELGDLTQVSRNRPTDVALLTNVIAIESGWRYTCAIVADGSARCWGDNEGDGFAGGQLGDGTRTRRLVPTPVQAPGVVFTALSAGGNHTCGITSAGGVMCWGDNARGELGDGTRTARLTPVNVSGLSSGVVAIAAGGLHPFLDEHTCAVKASGAVLCWGSNRFGQLGDGSSLDRITPTPSSHSGSIIDVAAGGDHSCALSNTGAVSCWGYDQYGQLGNGSRDPAVPGSVLSLRAASARSASNGNQSSQNTASDASGQFLVFESMADALVSGDSNGALDIFRRDSVSGSVMRVSVDNAGAQIAGSSREPAVSANGNFAVFVAPDAGVGKLWGESKAQQAARIKASTSGVFLRNLLAGTTQRVGTAMPAGSGTEPQISANGTTVVFTALPTSAAQGDTTKPVVFSQNFDLVGTTLTPRASTPTCVSCKSITATGANTSENAAGTSGGAVISADGTWLAFETDAKNLLNAVASPCPGPTSEIILRNLLSGTTQRVSPPSGTTDCGSAGASNPTIDYSGLQIAYESDAPLKPGDSNLMPDVYLYSGSGLTTRISEDTGAQGDGNGASTKPNISGDGKVIVFASTAKNHDTREPDNNERDDVVAVRLDRSDIKRVSLNPRGDQANGNSRDPVTNYAGTLIAFDSSASNLVLNAATGQSLDANGVDDVFQVSNPVTSEVIFRSGME